MIAISRFSRDKYPAGTHSNENPINITNIDKVHLKCNCSDDSFVNGRRESFFFSFSLSAPPGFKEPTSILFKTVSEDKIGDITLYIEDDNNIVEFNGETLTFTVMLIRR